MLRDTYPYYLANRAVQANTDLEVTDKYTGKVATRVAQADAAAIHAAIDAAVKSQKALRNFRPYQRKAVLEHCVKRFKERFEEMADGLQLFDCFECGCCSFVCPSHIPLVQSFRVAKNAVRKKRAAP